ncbi:MAG: type VI secretion system baseplate subunit TssF [Deltaproteobacteria bacterium]
MDDDFLSYYERELTFVREMGSEFANKYPKIAGRLLLEPDKCEDPHTERLIEAFAFLCARIHRKIDDDFPEITQALLNILYPHYTNPIPSMSVVRFSPALKNIPAGGYRIEKETQLFSKPVGGIPCQFTTAYPVTLWPLEVVGATLAEPKRLVRNAQQAVSIRLKLHNNLTFSNLECDRLRFFLNGQRQNIFHLYELLCNNVCHIECEAVGSAVPRVLSLGAGSLKPVGFDDDEGLLPYPKRSFPGYRLLFEYFCFPEKFLFFEIEGLGKLVREKMGDTIDLHIYLDKAAKSTLLVTVDTFCLHATPIVNTFKRIAEPIRVEHQKIEYRVLPDIRRIDATEVLSIDSVTASRGLSVAEAREYKPLYSIQHHRDDDGEGTNTGAYWQMQRRSSGRKGDNGTDVFLSFCDLMSRSVDPAEEIVTVHVTCTNRDLPARLPFGDVSGDFETEMAAPIGAIHCLCKPTASIRSVFGGALHWRLISHLSLNYLSMVEGGEGALKEILRLYDFDNSPVTRQQINGIVSLQSNHITKRIGQAFCRGVQVTIEFDEDKYVGTGLFLFASVLERFLGQYVSVNSFVQLIARTQQRKEAMKKWPPRNGNRVLL